MLKFHESFLLALALTGFALGTDYCFETQQS